VNVVPKLTELVSDPNKVSLVPAEAIPVLRRKLAELDTLLLGRLLQSGNDQGQTPADGDRLLDVKEAAAKLSRSEDYLYRNAGKLPFTVRDGRCLRFSEAGIDRWIRQRAGQ
jgi:predicted DNA-binding transcriptional regulator AlpA